MYIVYCFVTINDTVRKKIIGKPSSLFRDDSLKNEKRSGEPNLIDSARRIIL